MFWAPGMVSAMDMTVVLLCRALRLKGVPEVKVMVLGSQGSSRKALSLNLQVPHVGAQHMYRMGCHEAARAACPACVANVIHQHDWQRALLTGRFWYCSRGDLRFHPQGCA